MGIEVRVEDACDISIDVKDRAGLNWIYESLSRSLRRFAAGGTPKGKKPMIVRKGKGNSLQYYGPKAIPDKVLRGYTGVYSVYKN